MRLQMCRFIRAGSSASVNRLPSRRREENSSDLLPPIPYISSSKNLTPRTNPDKLLSYWRGMCPGFRLERPARPLPPSLYDNVLQGSFCRIGRLCYHAAGHENNRNPPKQSSLRAVEPKESPKTSILRRWAGYLFGSVITFWWGKQADLLKIKGDLQKAAEGVEDAAEIVENVATLTEEISKDVAEKFPEGGKIQTVALFVEHLSEEAIEDARKTREFIEKVTKAEKTAETGVVTAIEALEDLISTAHNGHDGPDGNKANGIN